MVPNVNNPVTGYTAFNKTVILPRKANTVNDRAKNDTFEVEQALKRSEPLTPVSYVDELDLNAPLISFLAEPTGQGGKIVNKNIHQGAWWGGILGGLFSLGQLLSQEHRPNSPVIGIVIVMTGISTVIGMFLGGLLGQAKAEEIAKNQQWVNTNMLEMMKLTSPNTLLKEANKVLQEDTGESFTQRLANRQNREQMQVTQELVTANIGVSASR